MVLFEKVEDLFKGGKFQQEQKKKFAGLEQQLKGFQKKKVRDPFAKDEPSPDRADPADTEAEAAEPEDADSEKKKD